MERMENKMGYKGFRLQVSLDTLPERGVPVASFLAVHLLVLPCLAYACKVQKRSGTHAVYLRRH